jgi:hypothetical protein
MLKAVLLSTAALALIATSADARPQVNLSKDNRFVSVLPQSGQSTPAKHLPGYLVSTIAKNPNGAYFCCYGSTLSGPSSFFGVAYGVAEQFIPSSSASVTKLYAGVGYVSGDDKVTLTLYADSGSNSPGKKLASGTGTATTEFGFCCNLVEAKIHSQSLTSGTPYWVAITVGGSDFDAAGFQVNNEVNDYHYLSYTSNGGSTWSSGVSETEYNPAIAMK